MQNAETSDYGYTNGDVYDMATKCLHEMGATIRNLKPTDLELAVEMLLELEQELFAMRAAYWLDDPRCLA